ncbi:LysR family transcriptional regulator [Oceaniradius stylonematis]|uniref:LysR family transcriptional regulator n=1 Tax=Oceaniradius stylonematis TaxID=2184161 RepID=UPI0013147901|nr:LysR family transcriptional regulator [Oceaniradius stylonematis]
MTDRFTSICTAGIFSVIWVQLVQHMIEFDSKLARTFLYVCQERTLRAAAYSLDLEPSSVSRQINTLETQLGLPLLERSRKGVVPTEAGRLLLDHLRRQRADNEALLSDFDALRGMQRGEIVIAIGDGFISDFMANALPSFRAALPGISFQLLSGSTEKVAKLVREDVAHFGFAINPDREQALRVIERVRQPLEVLLSPQSKHAGSGVAMSMSQLTEIPLALPRPDFGIGTLLRETEATYGVRLVGAGRDRLTGRAAELRARRHRRDDPASLCRRARVGGRPCRDRASRYSRVAKGRGDNPCQDRTAVARGCVTPCDPCSARNARVQAQNPSAERCAQCNIKLYPMQFTARTSCLLSRRQRCAKGGEFHDLEETFFRDGWFGHCGGFGPGCLGRNPASGLARRRNEP